MNQQLQNFARQTIKDGLALCTEDQQLLFKRLYSHKNLDLPIDVVVDRMPESSLEIAMDQVQRTVDKNAAKAGNNAP